MNVTVIRISCNEVDCFLWYNQLEQKLQQNVSFHNDNFVAPGMLWSANKQWSLFYQKTAGGRKKLASPELKF